MDEPKGKNKKIKKGDRVMATTGNYRGQFGTVLSRQGDKVIVQGLNVRKKHVKPSQENQRGGIIELEKPIHISNLRLCTEDNKPIKVKVRVNDKGEKHLVYKVDGEEITYRSVK